jgi:hypothetical protein
MVEIKIIQESVTLAELRRIAAEQFGDFVKAVIDIEHGIMAIGGELHADMEVILMEQHESKREFTWGINLYPEKSGDEFIEFDSMINLKPAYGNRSRGISDIQVQEKIRSIVKKLIVR